MEKVNLFVSYSHEDKECLELLKLHVNEKDCPHVNIWFDEYISLGAPWDEEIKKKLNDSQIVLFIISPAFWESVYINNVELITALARRQQGHCIVIPIFAKTSDLDRDSELLSIQGFPHDRTPAFDKMKEKGKATQYLLLKNELNQIVKNVLREKVQLRLSMLRRNKIFLSIPQSETEREIRKRFLRETEQKRKYEKWEYQVVPATDEIESFYKMDADKQAAFISKFQKEALYSIHLIDTESCLEEGIAKQQFKLAGRSTYNNSIYKKIIWVLNGAEMGKTDRDPLFNTRVRGNDAQKIFDMLHNFDEEKQKCIVELEDFLRYRKNVFMFYNFKKDHNNTTRVVLKTMIEEYKNEEFQNIDLRLECSRPKTSLKQEEKFLAESQGSFIFYGNADATWFVNKQAILLDWPEKQAKCIYIDEPGIEEKVKRDLNQKPFTTEQFMVIKGSAELQSGVKDFLDDLIKDNS